MKERNRTGKSWLLSTFLDFRIGHVLRVACLTGTVIRTSQGLTAAELILHRSRSVSPGLLGAQRAAEAMAGGAAGEERQRSASRAAGGFDSLATRGGGSGGVGGALQSHEQQSQLAMLEAHANSLGVPGGGGGLGVGGWGAKDMNGAAMGLPPPSAAPAAASVSAAAATAAAAAAGTPGMPQMMASMQEMMLTPTLQVHSR